MIQRQKWKMALDHELLALDHEFFGLGSRRVLRFKLLGLGFQDFRVLGLLGFRALGV